ncbi:MAG: restriction endonuclease [Deltaproteobacteria bacterium]|nr:restriction endonuclease [Deltaproteobacteria bacterium]
MTVPDYQTLMLPVLEILSDQKIYHHTDLVDRICDVFKLTDKERRELLPSGNQTYILNRVGWARSYLKQAGLLHQPERGKIQITPRGIELLKNKPTRIDNKFLMKFDEFQEFRNRSHKNRDNTPTLDDTKTPQEHLENAYQVLNSELSQDILNRIKDLRPQFFEKLVVDLMIAMGYGGAESDSGQVTALTGDEGIDGIIKEDKLGLDVIYLQAKRWENPVSRPEIQKFVGALTGKRAKKGVFITTSRFTSEAIEYAKNLDCKVILIDGDRLADLMIRFNVGVQTDKVCEIKKTDEDYFEE